MQGKTVQETALTSTFVMLPQDANPAGNIHGGVTLKYIDTTAGIVAKRHSRCNVVTASIDRVDFLQPVYIGELLILKASLNMVGRTSMEIGVRVETENVLTGNRRHCVSAYLTFVALSPDGKPNQIPELILESPDEFRRNREAQERRKSRLAERVRERESQG